MIAPAESHLVWIALGSNLGERQSNLEGAIARLEALPGFQVLARSSWIETLPVGGPRGQGNFLNGALQGRTSLAPLALLDALQAIEAEYGRERRVHHGPRTLDLDLLLYGDQVHLGERLCLPHPELENRLFVLEPMSQLAPKMRLPGCGLTISRRLQDLRRSEAPGQPFVHAD